MNLQVSRSERIGGDSLSSIDYATLSAASSTHPSPKKTPAISATEHNKENAPNGEAGSLQTLLPLLLKQAANLDTAATVRQ